MCAHVLFIMWLPFDVLNDNNNNNNNNNNNKMSTFINNVY